MRQNGDVLRVCRESGDKKYSARGLWNCQHFMITGAKSVRVDACQSVGSRTGYKYCGSKKRKMKKVENKRAKISCIYFAYRLYWKSLYKAKMREVAELSGNFR